MSTKKYKIILVIVLVILICTVLILVFKSYANSENKLAVSNYNIEASFVTNDHQKNDEITQEQAIDVILNMGKQIFEMDIDENNLDISYSTGGFKTKHSVWLIGNDEFVCNVDVVSGQIILFCIKKEYKGKDSITEDDWHVIVEEIGKNPDNYIEASTEIVNSFLADGRQIFDVIIAGIQFGGEEESTGTVIVDCRVLMESGRSYGFSFEGEEMEITDFYSYPTKNACFWGYFWAEEAFEYPVTYDQ